MEHTFISHLGYSFGFLAFVAAIVSGIAYFLDVQQKTDEGKSLFKRVGRISFFVHAASIFSIVGLLFFLLLNHYYEFNYVHKYSNNSMPLKYIFACFWGGQEGSFLLWNFWHAVIGLLLIWKAKKWESSVLATLSLVQVFMSSMTLGIYIGDFKIGSSPFVLIRMLPENVGLPWTTMDNYMDKIPMFQDGTGLNPLLRNYWMTIHPPTLFLGFASTVVPFCYAIAGLWKKQFTAWVKPALPWAFTGVGILGLGILMGGAWAYESLSFGGFWAWDPVENVSYIPWLTFVGAAHLMLVNQKKPISIFLTVILTGLSFILVLYSTFLTRSGVLGDSSVHSFTGDGMLGQLFLYILVFVWLTVFVMLPKGVLRVSLTTITGFLILMGIFADYDQVILGINPSGVLFVTGFAVAIVYLVISYRTNFPRAEQEERLWSREFWMFIGSLVLFLACLQIFKDNSFPVWNKLFNDDAAKPEELLTYYNVYQGSFAVFVAIFVGFTQFLKYKKTDVKVFLKNILLSVLVSAGLTALSFIVISFSTDEFTSGEKIVYPALLFASIYAIVGNLDYWIRFLKGKLNYAGASIAHIGFGMVLLGALISNSQGEKLSNNKGNKFNLEELSENFKNDEDVQLTLGDTTDINEYFVVFNKRYQEGGNVYYDMDYFNKVNNEDGSVKVGEKAFSLNPFVQLNEQFGNAAEPATKHYVWHDVFTYIKYPNPSSFEGQNNGYMPYEQYEVNIGDTVFTQVGYIYAKQALVKPYREDQAGFATVELLDYDKKKLQSLNLIFTIAGDTALIPAPAEIPKGLDYKLGLNAFSPPRYSEDSVLLQPGRLALDIAEKEFVVMQAKTFPLINVLWLGIIIMFIGTIMASFYRLRRAK